MDNLFSEGLTLMAFGMGFVFVFLTLLVLVTGAMSRLATRFLPEPVKAPKARPQPAVAGASANNDEVVAAITAAVHKYRSK